jgi:hypothetical protein
MRKAVADPLGNRRRHDDGQDEGGSLSGLHHDDYDRQRVALDATKEGGGACDREQIRVVFLDCLIIEVGGDTAEGHTDED